MPAFATSRSTRPISSKPRSTDSREATSISTARPPVSSATAPISSRVRAVTTTDQPSPASARPTFAPIPRPPPVTTATPSGNCGLDRVERLRILESGDVARVGAERLRADGAADDLRGARLRQRLDEEDAVRLESLAELGGDVVGDLLLRHLRAREEAAEDPCRLALHVVRNADRGRLAHGRMVDRRRLQLRRPDALAGDVHRVVAAPVQEPVAVLVDGRPVAVHPHVRDARPVRLDELVGVAPEAARHPRERLAADELADLAGPEQRAAYVVDDVDRHPERRTADRTRLDRLHRSR